MLAGAIVYLEDVDALLAAEAGAQLVTVAGTLVQPAALVFMAGERARRRPGALQAARLHAVAFPLAAPGLRAAHGRRA